MKLKVIPGIFAYQTNKIVKSF